MAMNFTSWQLGEMRKALFAYRHERSLNGRLVPWKTILFKIEGARVKALEATYEPSPGEAFPEFREEALRRFANGESTLQPDKLLDVKRFLIKSGYMAESQFGDVAPELQKLFVACVNLAGNKDPAEVLGPGPNRSYVAMQSSSPTGETIFLEAWDDGPQGVLRITENRRARISDDSAEGVVFRRDQPSATSEYRRGYGCFSTGLGLLHVFLHGPSGYDDGAISYVQVQPTSSERRELILMRAGAQTPAVIDSLPNLSDGRFVAVANVYLFGPL